MIEIQYKKGTRYSVSAAKMYNEIEAAKEDGNLDPANLVRRSRPKNAPLHDEFTWDNRVAGDKWRVSEAKKMVRSLIVVREDAPTTRAYESVVVEQLDDDTGDREARPVYRNIEDILSDPTQRDELLAQAIRHVVAWRKRYSAIQELSQIIAVIDEQMLKLRA